MRLTLIIWLIPTATFQFVSFNLHTTPTTPTLIVACFINLTNWNLKGTAANVIQWDNNNHFDKVKEDKKAAQNENEMQKTAEKVKEMEIHENIWIKKNQV